MYGICIFQYFLKVSSPTLLAPTKPDSNHSKPSPLQTPLHADGFFGDAMNTLLAPDYLADLLHHIENPNEYLVAQKDGLVHNNCEAYEARCKLSLFEVG